MFVGSVTGGSFSSHAEMAVSTCPPPPLLSLQ